MEAETRRRVTKRRNVYRQSKWENYSLPDHHGKMHIVRRLVVWTYGLTSPINSRHTDVCSSQNTCFSCFLSVDAQQIQYSRWSFVLQRYSCWRDTVKALRWKQYVCLKDGRHNAVQHLVIVALTVLPIDYAVLQAKGWNSSLYMVAAKQYPLPWVSR